MSDLEIECSNLGDVARVNLRGSLDAVTRMTVKGDPACHPSDRPVVFDLSGLSHIDSAGLGCLIWILKESRKAEVGIVFAAPSEVTRHILDITMLSRVVPITETCEEGVALLKGHSK